jgi:phosphate transport system substrate-binding protein
VSTAETPGVNVNKVPDLALSDVFPGAATPPLPESAFNRTKLGVVPFLWVKSAALTGITNITREQAVLLMTASGSYDTGPAMPASYLGGVSTAPIFLVGRDSGSGTRISVEKDIGFVGTPTLWATNAAGAYVLTNGYSSGALERAVIATKPDAIGYLGRADFAAIATNAVAISYNGVGYSPENVSNGSYGLWGYEHIVNRAGGLSANQTLVRNALIAKITDSTFQNTNPLYNLSFESISEMHVDRGADGGTITSLDF